MKKGPESAFDTVIALLEERRKYDQWLTALQNRRDSTPPGVFSRVHADYTRRLAQVTDQIRSHSEELEEQAARLSTRLGELGIRETERLEQRAEAELRAHVGELSPDAWESTAKQADTEIAGIAAEQAVVAADLHRVTELLAAASNTPAPPIAGVESPAKGVEATTEPPVLVLADEPPTARSGTRSTGFDELAFLKSVVSPNRLGASGQRKDAAAARAAPKPGAGARAPGASDSVEQATRPARGGRSSVERGAVRDDETKPAGGLKTAPNDQRRGADRSFAANVSGNQPIMLRPSGAIEQPKTLKCAECGAMNYPTEWYCERCGAELAAL